MNILAYNFLENSVDFSTTNVWSFIALMGVLFLGVIIANTLKNIIPGFKKTLIPTSVLAGIIILIVSTIYQLITKKVLFDIPFFSITDPLENVVISGSNILEVITYQCLGIGFVAMGLRTNKNKNKVKTVEVINTGITTVCGYLLQAFVGILIAFAFYYTVLGEGSGFIPGSGVLLALGYGQGTGQALSFGTKYMNENGFLYGDHFGLAIAALGFLSASIGGVIYLNILKKQGKIRVATEEEQALVKEEYEGENEIQLSESIDKFTIQTALVILVYAVSYLAMKGLTTILPSMASTFFGFNFLLGTLFAVLLKTILNKLYAKGVIKKQYINNFMMNRIAGIAFDMMIVAGIAAINLELILDYWVVLLVMGLVGAAVTFVFVRFVCHRLFPDYKYEQFFAMYGMLTGTASTGMILLREIDPKYEAPASENLVYQNFPAIILGIPVLMVIAPNAAKDVKTTFIYAGIILAYLVVLLIVLFRKQIFKKKQK